MKKFIIGFLAGGLIFGATGVYAADQFKKAYIKEWGFSVCGEQVELANNIVTIDGNSYLPVKEIARSLGYEVSFNYEEKQVEATIYRDRFPSESCKFELVHESEKNEIPNTGLHNDSSSTNQTNSNIPTPTPSPTTTTNDKSSLVAAENERHNSEIQRIESSYNSSKDYINNRIAEIKREGPVGNMSDNEYEKKIASLLEERSNIQKQINTISRDDSFEGKAKRKELQEKLDKVDQEIADVQKARGAQTSIRALEDQLNTRTEGYKAELKQENELHRNNINAIK